MTKLIHYGVKGMRWGDRKGPDLSDKIVVRKKGETLHHVSANPNLSPDVREL